MMVNKAVQQITTSVLSPNTLTPFLFQTRTLRFLNCHRTQLEHRILCRTYSGTRNLRRPEDDGAGSDKTSSTTAWTPLISNSESIPKTSSQSLGESRKGAEEPHTSGPEPNSTKGPDVVRFVDADPVLQHQGRGTTDRGKTLPSGNSRYHQPATDFANITEGIDFEEDVDENWIGGKDEISELTRSRPLGESTITDSERYAFQKIFKDIFGKTQNAGIVKPGIDGVALQLESEAAKSARAEDRSKPQKLSRWEMEEIINKYPAPLRAAAARAMGLGQAERDGEEEELPREPDLDLERLEALREPERKRVETMMKAAETDFELWDTMEREVFSLISKLGLESVSTNTTNDKVKSKKRKPRSKKGAVQTQTETEAEASTPTQLDTFTVNENGISPLALYGPLYPSYLLLGLRLLDRNFSKSSPLTLTLLPKIKSLGVLSHVLGASSQLYNELIQVYRYRFDDYRGILQLLSEMEHSGIEFDQETLEIVKDIQKTQLSVRKGEMGEAIQALWSLPEFAPNRFKGWLEKIAADLKSRELNERITVTY